MLILLCFLYYVLILRVFSKFSWFHDFHCLDYWELSHEQIFKVSPKDWFRNGSLCIEFLIHFIFRCYYRINRISSLYQNKMIFSCENGLGFWRWDLFLVFFLFLLSEWIIRLYLYTVVFWILINTTSTGTQGIPVFKKRI